MLFLLIGQLLIEIKKLVYLFFFITKNVDDGYNSQKNIIILDNDNSVILTEKLIKIGKEVLKDTFELIK